MGVWSLGGIDGFLLKKGYFALDTGCVWGNYMTMLRWDDKKSLFKNQLDKTAARANIKVANVTFNEKVLVLVIITFNMSKIFVNTVDSV